MSTIEAISTERALKLALEALNTTESDCGSRAWEREQEAITALREALAQERSSDEQPAQRQARSADTWVGLTDVEWMNIVNKDQAWFGQRPDEVAHEVAKLVEAQLKEKNT